MYAPGGAQGNFVLAPAAADLFANALTVYVGVQPNNGPNVGQTAVLNSFRILTTFPGGIEDQTLLEDNFLTDAGCTLRIVLLDIPSGQVEIHATPARYEQLGGPVEQHLIGVEITHMNESDRYRFVTYLHTLS